MKLKLPDGVVSVSHEGKALKVSKKGIVEADTAAANHLVEAFGAVPAEDEPEDEKSEGK